MTRAMAAAVLLLTMTLAWPGHAELSGPAAVIDSDTIEVGGSPESVSMESTRLRAIKPVS